jgi:WD40 repeat protein
VNDKVPPREPLPTRTEAEGATVDLPEGLGFFAVGQVLGERYEILEMLGRGGMGEVWRAFDLKLRVEVALKALREDLFQTEGRREMLRQEVRAAREVISPNVCRIFDLIEIDGRELVSMEHIDGATLLGVLQERGPLELKEAQDIASQFLSGLEAIHKAGLVHRDVKPENIMLTRAGRVVVMDFGLARGPESGAGSVSGTPAYMAPEHAAGQEVDARADVYSAGVVLAEMVSPEGIKSYESRQSVWEGVRSEPAQVPDSPWAPVIQRAVARDRERRQNSAHTLIRELEDVTLRVEGAEDLHPYPGLASFTEEDAEFFFGREADIEAMWAKLDGPARLLGLVGPSGAGKTSFLRAGVIPYATPGWAIIRCTPGANAMASIRQALVPALAGDTEALGALAGGDDKATLRAWSIWRRQATHALLIVDQFEELFTLNPLDVQERLADLLRRLPLEADIHVVVSMRDDFLMECNRFEDLRPVVADLTLLDRPTGPNLRRALVQPATKCGYRFEDDELVEEILAEVEGERGALPLLAFALARLWEKRDRESGLLTRQAYHDIGGVGGALARHAEATVDRIGVERIPIVRELFRNLVTAEGTRAVREWDDLLSVFSDGVKEGIKPSPTNGSGKPNAGAGFTPARDAAEEVLRELIDARLLTSYEVREDEHEPTRRVEIIHESLLANWPRLVRWQTQDADAAQLRDQLRQAARTWDEHERSRDYLWTGRAYREYAVWRENYSGGLSELEEAFSQASIGHELRRKRRRRIAVASAFVALLVVLGIVGVFWQRSVTESRRAEAANLFSLAQLRLEDHPTATVAYAIRSLELADSPEMRRLALEALWQGPTEFRIPTGSFFSVDFSPDGGRLATVGGWLRGECRASVWPSNGGSPTVLEPKPEACGEYRFSPKGDLIASYFDEGRQLGLWSLPSGRFVRSFPIGAEFSQLHWFSRDGARIISTTEVLEGGLSIASIRSWPLDGGDPDLVARLEVPKETGGTFSGPDPAETRLGWIEGRTFNIAPLDDSGGTHTSSISLVHDKSLSAAVFDDDGSLLATSDASGTVTVWSLESDPPKVIRRIAANRKNNWCSLRFSRSGTMLCSKSGFLVDLNSPPHAEPLRLRRPGEYGYGQAFEPNGLWFAIGHRDSVSMWPLARRYPFDIRALGNQPTALRFTPDGKWIAAFTVDGTVRLWPLDSDSGQEPKVLFRAEGAWEAPSILAMAPYGSFVAAGNPNGGVRVLPIDGGPSRRLVGFKDAMSEVVVGPESRLVAGGAGSMLRQEALVRVWDVDTGEVRILDAGDGIKISLMMFTRDGDLWVRSGPMFRRWDLDEDPPRVVEELDLSGPEFAGREFCALHPDRRQILLAGPESLWLQSLDSQESMELRSHGGCYWGSLPADGDLVVSADDQNGILIGPATGEEPHLLLGRAGGPIEVSPDRRWVVSRADDRTIRFWPMPDFSKPPLHTLPRDELVAKLKTLTNLRVVKAPDSPSGWTLTHDPFPGWETVPEW